MGYGERYEENQEDTEKAYDCNYGRSRDQYGRLLGRSELKFLYTVLDVLSADFKQALVCILAIVAFVHIVS